jgi:hypothetical protein
MIGRPFPEVDQSDRPGLAISWPDTQFPFYNANLHKLRTVALRRFMENEKAENT